MNKKGELTEKHIQDIMEACASDFDYNDKLDVYFLYMGDKLLILESKNYSNADMYCFMLHKDTVYEMGFATSCLDYNVWWTYMYGDYDKKQFLDLINNDKYKFKRYIEE